MVATTIYFKSLGINSTSQLYLFKFTELEFNRQLDGLFRMEVLIALLNLLRAVSPCKDFLRFPTRLSIYLFIY